MKLLVIFLAFAFACGEKARFDNYRVYNIKIENDEQYKLMKYIEENSDSYNFWSDPGKFDADLMVPPHKFNDFEELVDKFSLKTELLIKDVQRLMDYEQAANLRARRTQGIAGVMDWISYHTHDEVLRWIDDLAILYPQYINVTTIGQSYEGRPIKLVHLSKRPNNRAIMLEGTIHAREWISPATLTYILNQLLTSSDPDVQEVANNVDWYFIPFANPDGYVHTWNNNRNWRKTRSRVSALCFGVDGNRNFAYNWLVPDETGNEGGSRSPCTDTFAGSHPYSEPETQATEGFLLKQAHQIDAFIAMHSYGHLFLHPWGHTRVPAAAVEELGSVGRAGAAAILAENGIDYTVGSSNQVLYASTGTSRDHTHGAHGIPISFTCEMRGNGPYGNFGFVLPPEHILPNSREVLKGFIALIRDARRFGRFPMN